MSIFCTFFLQVVLLSSIFFSAPNLANANMVDANIMDTKEEKNAAAENYSPQNSSSQNASFQLTIKDAEEAVSKALQEAGVGENISASLTSSRAAVLYYHHRPLSVQLKTIKFDKTANNWSANILILDNDEVLSAIPASGRYEFMELIPVIKKRIKHGEIINAEDIEMRSFVKRSLPKEVLRNRADLENHTPKRLISPLRPIRKEEIQMPDLIHKGDLVKIFYKNNNIEISTQGEAMEDGEMGKTIRVKNIASNKTVRGIVTGEKEVAVGEIAVGGVANGETKNTPMEEDKNKTNKEKYSINELMNDANNKEQK